MSEINKTIKQQVNELNIDNISDIGYSTECILLYEILRELRKLNAK